MSGTAEKELEAQLEAIKSVTAALRPLTPGSRQKVIDFVQDHLEFSPTQERHGGIGTANAATKAPGHPAPAASHHSTARKPDIRTFASEKAPQSANEMAATIAYFLSEISPDKQESVSTTDVVKLYKQANTIKLPKDPSQTLKNAAKAGYFDQISRGNYKLNAVGYNLVAHNLPKNGNSSAKPKRR